jgi:Arc/MetJ family transcription regulator
LRNASNDAIFDALREIHLRTTVTLDDELLAKAQAISGLKEKSAIIRQAFEAYIGLESARRLALLGGSEPKLKSIRRRKSK